MPGTITCTISGITQQVTVLFKDGNQDIYTVEGVTHVEQGIYYDNSQIATLVVDNVQADKTYTCVVTSGEYPSSGGQATEVAIKMFGM